MVFSQIRFAMPFVLLSVAAGFALLAGLCRSGGCRRWYLLARCATR